MMVDSILAGLQRYRQELERCEACGAPDICRVLDTHTSTAKRELEAVGRRRLEVGEQEALYAQMQNTLKESCSTGFMSGLPRILQITRQINAGLADLEVDLELVDKHDADLRSRLSKLQAMLDTADAARDRQSKRMADLHDLFSDVLRDAYTFHMSSV